MGVDCDSVSGYGIEMTSEILEKMIAGGLFTLEQYEYDPSDCLSKANIYHGVAGSYYSGETCIYLFAEGNNPLELIEGAKQLIEKLNSVGVNIKMEDLKFISDVLWS